MVALQQLWWIIWKQTISIYFISKCLSNAKYRIPYGCPHLNYTFDNILIIFSKFHSHSSWPNAVSYCRKKKKTLQPLHLFRMQVKSSASRCSYWMYYVYSNYYSTLLQGWYIRWNNRLKNWALKYQANDP